MLEWEIYRVPLREPVDLGKQLHADLRVLGAALHDPEADTANVPLRVESCQDAMERRTSAPTS
jgi:hypothetical protein